MCKCMGVHAAHKLVGGLRHRQTCVSEARVEDVIEASRPSYRQGSSCSSRRRVRADRCRLSS